MRKGIILAGGNNTRLYPITLAVSKQLVPVYDKPMVYYPLATLLTAGINEILIIVKPQDLTRFQDLLGDESHLGISIQFATRGEARGIADALVIGREFLAGQPVALILGDNLFHGHGLLDILRRASTNEQGGTVFAYKVADPQRYGIVEFDGDGRAISVEENPTIPRSPWAVGRDRFVLL